MLPRSLLRNYYYFQYIDDLFFSILSQHLKNIDRNSETMQPNDTYNRFRDHDTKHMIGRFVSPQIAHTIFCVEEDLPSMHQKMNRTNNGSLNIKATMCNE